jgi:predicted transcriptional regulator
MSRVLIEAQIRERMLAIEKGEYKPKPSEPRSWFISMKSLAEVLSDENRALLKVINETKPESISGLAAITGRKPSNLSRTLRTMSRYGLVELKRGGSPCPPGGQGHAVPDFGGLSKA